MRWSSAELGHPPDATIRVLLPLPDGRIAVGSDRTATLFDGVGATPFPFPPGAQKRARVEALGWRDGTLSVATDAAWFDLDVDGIRARRLPFDDTGTRDDVLAILGPIVAWRTHLEGGVGPADSLSLATDGRRTWAGTRGGIVAEVDGDVLLDVGRPVRHLAWAGALYAAAAGRLWRWDGAWTSQPGEPTSLCGDGDRLWLVRDGVVCDGVHPRPERIERPWCLAATADALWVGAVGALWKLSK